MAKDPAVFSIECDCYSRADVSLPKSKDSSPGAHDTPDLYEVARRLSVQVDAPPWGIDRIDTDGEPAVRRTSASNTITAAWLWPLAQLPRIRLSSLYRSYRLSRGFLPSSLAPRTGGAIDGSYDDGDLTGTGIRVYIVDTGVQASHRDFADRVVNGHTVRAH